MKVVQLQFQVLYQDSKNSNLVNTRLKLKHFQGFPTQNVLFQWGLSMISLAFAALTDASCV